MFHTHTHTQKSNDRRQSDAPRWFENPQFLYIPPIEYQSYSIEENAVFHDPWEDYYKKQVDILEEQQRQQKLDEDNYNDQLKSLGSSHNDNDNNQSISHDTNWTRPPDNNNNNNGNNNSNCSYNTIHQEIHVESKNYEEHSYREDENVHLHSSCTERQQDTFDSNNNNSSNSNASQPQEHHSHYIHQQHHQQHHQIESIDQHTVEFRENIEIVNENLSQQEHHSIKNSSESISLPSTQSQSNQPNVENNSANSGNNSEPDSTLVTQQVGNFVKKTKTETNKTIPCHCYTQYSMLWVFIFM